MTRHISQLTLLIALTALVGLFGCNGATPGGADQGDGHDQGSQEHGHHHEGPHDGHIIELGDEEYHAELNHDEATKTVTIYLLDKEAKRPVAIPAAEITLNLVIDGQPTQIKLAAEPQDGDAQGQASRFSATDEKVIVALESEKTTGRLNVTIDGKPYSGVVEHHEHGEHKH